MILADKILTLRKKSGWSQEELAQKLNVSRQSVSKWESASAIPDINKIIEMSKIFGVTTDYLLKDDFEEPTYTDTDEDTDFVRVKLDDANNYIKDKISSGWHYAIGTMLCIFGPIFLITLSAFSEEGIVKENVGIGIGMAGLLTFVALAVGIFIVGSEKMKKHSHLEPGNFELDYGVKGIINDRRNSVQKRHLTFIIIGAMICILSPLPLITVATIGCSDFVATLLTSLLLFGISVGVFLLILTNNEKNAYEFLLMEGEFHPREIKNQKRSSKLAGIFWPIIVAIYLLTSFITYRWDITWLIFPIAGLTYAAIATALKDHKDF